MQSIRTCFTLPKKRILRNTDVTHTTAEFVVHFVDRAWDRVHKYSLTHHKCATNDATPSEAQTVFWKSQKWFSNFKLKSQAYVIYIQFLGVMNFLFKPFIIHYKYNSSDKVVIKTYMYIMLAICYLVVY